MSRTKNLAHPNVKQGKKLENDLAAMAQMSAAQLQQRWTELLKSSPPNLPISVLRPLLAQLLQERRLGGLPVSKRRELDRLVSDQQDGGPTRPRIELTPGTRLIRDWNGRTISVDVLEEGFAFEGKIWRSLSEIARHVTGAHWSGPRFFGLTSHG